MTRKKFIPSGKTVTWVSVRSAHRCPIVIRAGLFTDLAPVLARVYAAARVFVITDSNVKRLYGRTFFHSLLESGVDAWLIDVPAGEPSKNANLVSMLHTQLIERNVRRDSVVVALGGGVVGDLAGYVAATVLRGVSFIQVPTTLLAQVDSSVGGKVGINHDLGKNLIGAFYPPEAVYIDPALLKTLPEREYFSGLSEVVKIAAALDKSFFSFLERNAAKIKLMNRTALTEMITRSVRLKTAIVEKDEFETGLRKALNVGHTIGHAIEAANDYRLRHGEAVAMGLVAESRIARDMGLLGTKDFARLLHLMHLLGLRIAFPRIRNRELFFSALALDKKSSGISPRFVLLRKIGVSVVGVDVPGPFIHALIGRPS